MTVAAQGTKVTFQKELFFSCMPELPPLFLAEWEEALGEGEVKQDLAPAWDKYVAMEMAGTMYFFTARAGSKLVGYILSIIHPHLHFSNTLYSFTDALYITPEYRDENAEDFIAASEKEIAAQGVQRITVAIPALTWQYRLMKKLQYDRTECIFSKWL